jgi:hypothetical protein
MDKPFRMLVEAVGSTVFFVRRENSPTELIPGVRGFGHTFPEAYTTWEADVKRSETHQRILRYAFGGMDCLVRFEADGYHKNLVSEGSESEVERASESGETGNLDDTLASAFNKSTITSNPPAHDKPLTVIRGGRRIPQSSIFNLKTRSVRKRDQDTLSEELPRLWLAQISNFILAYHQLGLFEEIQTQNVRHEVEDWERENEDTLLRLAALMRKIAAFARDKKDRKLEVRHHEIGVLELREQREEVGHALPAGVGMRWVLGEFGGSDGSGDESIGPDNGEVWGPDDLEWDEGSEKDFTACSADECGYCGHCSY